MSPVERRRGESGPANRGPGAKPPGPVHSSRPPHGPASPPCRRTTGRCSPPRGPRLARASPPPRRVHPHSLVARAPPDQNAPTFLVYATPVGDDGARHLSLPIPKQPALAGLELHAQTLTVNLTGGIPGATSNLVSFELLEQ